MAADSKRVPRWREDFPIQWERDHYITRRELAKFLTLGSGLLVGANIFIAFLAKLRAPTLAPAKRIASLSALDREGSILFRYPTDEDPCILVRTREGQMAAYSQVCTHLSCAVVYQSESECLFCPCHHGAFSASEGRPIAGPPTRRLHRIRLDVRSGEIYAIGIEV
jgi:nitrite reductase/ring-hydroxylating ferredoxin subunit